MSKYFITLSGTKYDLNNLIDTSGSSITTLYTGFPTSSTPACNFQKLANNINYRVNGIDLSNKCLASSRGSNTSLNFNVPAGFSKISGILASGGGGGGGGGGTQNADLNNNNDSGAGGGGGGSGAIVVLKNYPVNAGDNITVNVGARGNGAPQGNANVGQNGNAGGPTILTRNGITLLNILGGGGGNGGDPGNADVVGINEGNLGLGGSGGTVSINNISSFTSVYNGSPGATGSNAVKGTPGKGGNGAGCPDVNVQPGNTDVYLIYLNNGAAGNAQTGNGIGTTGSNALDPTFRRFANAGGGGSGSGQGKTTATSGGGNGQAGFAIIYLYF